jgi:hypothetical protein
MRSLLSTLLLIIVAAPATAQQIGGNKTTGTETYTISMKVQLVVEAVVVKDKQGNPIPDSPPRTSL